MLGYDETALAGSQSPSNSHSTYDTSIAIFDRVKLHGSFEIQQVVSFFYMSFAFQVPYSTWTQDVNSRYIRRWTSYERLMNIQSTSCVQGFAISQEVGPKSII